MKRTQDVGKFVDTCKCCGQVIRKDRTLTMHEHKIYVHEPETTYMYQYKY